VRSLRPSPLFFFFVFRLHMAQPAEDPAGEQGTAEQLDEQPRSLLLNILGQLRIGMDLSKVTLPTFILEPRSFIEMLSDFVTHCELVVAVPTAATPEERFIGLIRWYLSGFYMRPKGVKKPYNPLLGEYYRCSWDHGDSRTFYYAEQVAHHPPMSAFYLSNRKLGVVVNGFCVPRSKYYGNSAASILDGFLTVYLTNHGEEYQATFPTIYGRGILFGTLLMEICGQVTLSCEQTGYRAELNFKEKGFFSGEYNKVEGTIMANKKKVASLSGLWNQRVECKMSGEKKTFDLFNIDTIGKPHARDTRPLADLQPIESQRVWADVTTAIQRGDQTAATEAKTFLEDRQRAEAKERAESGAAYEPRHFYQNEKEEWVYKHLNTSRWNPDVDLEEVEEDGRIYTKTK